MPAKRPPRQTAFISVAIRQRLPVAYGILERMDIPNLPRIAHAAPKPTFNSLFLADKVEASMSDAPLQSYRFLRKFLPKSLQPTLRGFRKRLLMPDGLTEPYRTVFPYTQVHRTRQGNLLRLAKLVDERAVPGVIVECGVLDGGTAAIMAVGTNGREVHLFDSWEGLPAVTAEDGDAAMWSGQVVGSPKRVIAVMKALGIDQSRLHFHKGWFADTFPVTQLGNVALLHIDGDFYDSVRLTLAKWAPEMSPGGFIQIDDYDSFAGCTKAVDEFLSKHPSLELQFIENEAKAFYIQIPDSW